LLLYWRRLTERCVSGSVKECSKTTCRIIFDPVFLTVNSYMNPDQARTGGGESGTEGSDNNLGGGGLPPLSLAELASLILALLTALLNPASGLVL
jgi:hypothetical protein